MSSERPQSDAELLVASRDDIEAFGCFYRRHVRWVLAFLVRRLGDAELAADVTSEVFAAALLGVDRYDPARGEANSWLFGIVTNQLRTAAKRGAAEDRARRRLAMEPVSVDASDLAWIETLADAGESEGVVRLLSELPADQRELVRGRVIDERTYEDLAGELRLPQATIRKRVSRGLATLRIRLQEGQRR